MSILSFCKAGSSVALLACAVVSANAQSAGAASACLAAPTLLRTADDPFLDKAIHVRTQRALDRGEIAADGRTKLTQENQAGTRHWYIENQRSGGDFVEAGVALHDTKLVDAGMRALEYGFSRQAPDGGFPESGDGFHSLSIFLIEAAKGVILIKQGGAEFAAFDVRAKALLPKIDAAGQWLLRPDVLKAGKDHDAPFTHRRWILAAALGLAGQATGDAQLTKAAVPFAEEGASLQKPDGLNPERDGFDVSYEMVDALQAGRYYTTLSCGQSAALMAKVRLVMARTCGWEEQRMLPDGSIDVAGSTRMGKETNRDGSVKTINYKEVVQAFTYTGLITRDPHFIEIAHRLAHSQKWE